LTKEAERANTENDLLRTRIAELENSLNISKNSKSIKILNYLKMD